MDSAGFWGEEPICGVVDGRRVTRPLDANQSDQAYFGVKAASGERLAGAFIDASSTQIANACTLAEEAFTQLSHRRDDWRGQLLEGVAAQMDSQRESILARCKAETGYEAARVAGEFARATGQLRLFAELSRRRVWDRRQIDPADPSRTPMPRQELRRRMLPLGPVAVFGACNFPLAISVVGNDFVAALAVGCPVIVKAHPGHPGTCQMLGEVVSSVASELGLPTGVFALLQGLAPKTSLGLVQNAGIAAVGFTGSPIGGKAIASALLQRPQPIPMFAELGSTNPVFFTAAALDERLEAIADGFAGSLRFGNGQLCTKPSVLVVPTSHERQFADAIVKRLAAAEPLPVLGERIAADFDAGVAKLKSGQGVETLHGGPVGKAGPFHRGAHLFRMPASIAIRDDWLHCETFGPVSTIVSCEDQEQWLEVGRCFSGSLTTTLHAESQQDASLINRWLAVAERFAGRIIRDGWPTGMEIGPATHHGGPYPASLDGRSTSVGYASLERFVRPACYQNWPADSLGPASDWSEASGPIDASD